MKKWYHSFVLFIFVCSTFISIPMYARGESSLEKLQYAKESPKVDGKIDAIWDGAEKMYGSKINELYGTLIDVETYEGKLLDSYAQMLWNEDGLFLLGVVFDTTITESNAIMSNSVDFWVSEKNTKSIGYEHSGDWHYRIAADGTTGQYAGNNDISDQVESAVKVYDNKYVVEMYVPYQSDLSPKKGTIIGFNVSFNDDIDGDGVGDICTYWKVSDESNAYWDNTKALPEVMFATTAKKPILLWIMIVILICVIVFITIVMKHKNIKKNRRKRKAYVHNR